MSLHSFTLRIQGIHVAPAKANMTDRQTRNKVIPICCFALLVTQKVQGTINVQKQMIIGQLDQNV